MSHYPERKEKDCLNCGTMVHGRYCHVCGQENIIAKESFWSLSKHFVYDIFHFDGKFFHTLKYLFTRPGKVAKEYCEGKRNTYLHPIRMYLFTSAVFFIIFFSVNDPAAIIKGGSDSLDREARQELIGDYSERLKTDTANKVVYQSIISILSDSSRPVLTKDILTIDPKPVFTVNGNRYSSVQEYVSAQKALPSEQRDNWFRSLFTRRALKFNEKYRGRFSEGVGIFWKAFLHRLPYMLFFSLPFFALILKLLYARRKNFYYSDHSVFTLYHYVFSFLLLLVIIVFLQLQKWTGLGDLDWVALLLVLTWMGYLLIEMKNFYRQGWIKTILKFLLLDFLGLIVMIILFFAFFLLSIFEV